MARVPADTPAASLRLHYAGPSGARVVRDANEAGIAERVVNHGIVDHVQARSMVESALAAVVVSSDGYEYALPGKVFEILAAGTPILVMAPGSSEVLAMAKGSGLGWGHELDDVEGITRSLGTIASNETHFDFEQVELTARHQMNRLDEALRNLI
jgi:glycosyltransferase involved in cell wall biosynthesis